MNRASSRLVAFCAGSTLLGAGLGLARSASAQDRFVLVGATLIDGTGSAPIPQSRVVIVGDRFECTSGREGCPTDASVRVVDLEGSWLTPGLIDTHVHLDYDVASARTAREQSLRFALGVTTVRDAGSLQAETMLAERDRSESSAHPFPRIVVAERPTAPYDRRLGVALGAPLVERLAAMGVDAIKVKDNAGDSVIRLEEIRAAAALGLPVFGHTWTSPPPRDFTLAAVRAGLSGVSHLDGFAVGAQPPHVDLSTGPPEGDPDHWPWIKRLWLSADTSALHALAVEMAEHGAWLEPTLGIEYYWGKGLRPPAHLGFLRDRPPSLRDLLTGTDVLAESLPPTFPAPYEGMTNFVRDFDGLGGLVVTGSDNLRPGLDLHEEIALLRRAGLTPMESLRASTATAAHALARDDIGVIEVGRLADAVVHDIDPLGPPGSTLHIRYVVKGGVLYASSALLAPFRDSYAAMEAALWRSRALRGLRLVALLMAAALALGFAYRRLGVSA